MNFRFLFFLLFFCSFIYSQNNKNYFFKPNKIGFLYNYANEKNFLFDDTDYYYTTNTFKSQFFYNLGNWKTLNFELVIQPQIQFLKHQLLNEQFVLPNEENFKEKRLRFTKLKNMNLYSIEFGFSINQLIIENLFLKITASVGLSVIDTETERLAKGFTFIENGSIGFTYQTSLKTALYLGTNIGHVSNFDFQKPNSGFNIVGFEIGISYQLK
ncbi:acyloxyacyl hydrolase [Polaribacter aquimarinus]|uniref:Lipid A 3-O-deacylase (PagL) n=1 Tax=Polaribacter aquimarinus TaxID=2100726 RepID=A0A2U2J7D2_9FLAO|nr:acyloxyacyl hydrolase [Polaribacter aquimarinus]PWG04234.1 hypothetical protein DIS07_12515 [Polaribacter aquimarinus]